MKIRFMMIGVCVAVLGALLVTTLSSFTGQDASPQYVTLNAFDEVAALEPKIVIVYENNSTEEIRLEKTNTAKGIQSNAIKVHETINLLSHKGYRLVSALRVHGGSNYIFERKAP